MNNCQCQTEINRDGSGQLGRFLKALDPSYAPVDGRSLEDLLVFTKRYADQIRFYDIPESKPEGASSSAKVSWREFFRRDMAVIAASISTVDTGKIKRSYDEIRQQLELYPTPRLFGSLFDPVIGIISRTDRWYSVAIPENPLRADLDLVITSSLREETRKILAYEAGFRLVYPNKPLGLDFSNIENPDLWGLQDPVDPVSTIYDGNTEEEKIRNAALYVDELFLKFYGFIAHLVETSDRYMQFALEQYPSHQPHMALFIAFLELFRKVQEQMNGLTERMLDFYYRDVLRLLEKPSIPDRVNIVFELAKDVNAFALAAGTRLSAGKDAAGIEQGYITTSDFVINRAKVKELKNQFIEKQMVAQTGKQIIQAFYARPQAKSQDGFGAVITDPSGKWYPFGRGSSLVNPSKNPCNLVDQITEEFNRKDNSSIGFAIASPQLVLQGGKRMVRMFISGLGQLLQDASGKEIKSPFEIFLTAEKGWLKISHLLSKADYDNVTRYLNNGIFNPESAKVERGYYIENGESVFIYLPVDEQSIINYDPEIHKGFDFRTGYPVMRVMLSSRVQLLEESYGSILCSHLALEIRVGSVFPSAKILENDPDRDEIRKIMANALFDGVKTLVIQNDDGLVAPDKPFDPFTAYPDQGKSFFIGSDEVFNKQLDQLAVNIRNNQQRKIFLSTQNTKDLGVSLLENRSWTELKTETGTDFTNFFLEQNILFQLDPSGKPVPVGTNRRPVLPVTEWNSKSQKGFIRLTYLATIPTNEKISFLQASQEVAPKLKINELSVSYHSLLERLESDLDQFFHVYPFGVAETYINPPGVSESARPSVSRSNRDYMKLNQLKGGLLIDANNSLLPRFSYVSPYTIFDKSKPSPIVRKDEFTDKLDKISQSVKGANPSFDYARVISYGAGVNREQNAINQYSGKVQEEGMLLMGFENVSPLQTLSLLFQFAEGSAMDEDHDPPAIHWSYLSYNEWKPMKGEHLISDGTFGFQATGIVRLEVPADANSHHTIFTDGLYWICASVTEHAERIPMLVDIITQAVEAVFKDNGNDPSHFDNALPAGSISKLEVTEDEISKTEQPFSSFDGKKPEKGREFYTHASERLRHKNRAISVWDYEHLILNRFPEIYKVKCIPHTDPECLCRHTKINTGKNQDNVKLTLDKAGALLEREFQSLLGNRPEKKDENCCGPQAAPGHVLLIPIANFKNRNAVNPLQPKTGKRTLLEIEGFVKKLTSPFVHIHAKNPVYEEIIVAFRVKFYDGYDKGYYLKKLNEEIVHFLTPWAFDEQAEVIFGEKVYASGIINFIEERVYVDFITDFFMAVCREECCPGNDADKYTPLPPGKEGALSHAPSISSVDITKICSCEELLYLIAGHNKFKGEIVAVPSGPRSILVSVPQHIIIPYEEPVLPSPCDDRLRKVIVQNEQ